jgi:hypothetical protein
MSSMVERLCQESSTNRRIKKICAKADQSVYDMSREFVQTRDSEFLENLGKVMQLSGEEGSGVSTKRLQ